MEDKINEANDEGACTKLKLVKRAFFYHAISTFPLNYKVINEISVQK